MFWELSRRRDIMVRLQTELDDAMPDRKVIPDASVLSRLPYLNAFIREGQCLFHDRDNSPLNIRDSFASLWSSSFAPGTSCPFQVIIWGFQDGRIF